MFVCAWCNTGYADECVGFVRFDIKVCKFCFGNEYPRHTQPIYDASFEGVELLYKNRDLHENAQLGISGRHIREIIVQLELAKRSNQNVFAQLIEMGIKGVVIEAKPKQPDETPRYVYALFVSE